MKPNRLPSFIRLLALSCPRTALTSIVVSGVLSVPLVADTFTWDTVADATAVTGGAGTWDAGVTGTTNWTQDSGATNIVWPDTGTDNDAVFGGTAGIVAIAAGGVVANDLTFNSVSYTVNGGSLTLNGATNLLTATTNSGTAITISAPLAGTSGFSKTGQGSVLLNGDNSGLSGTITLPNVTGTNNAGLTLSGAGSIGGITQIDINGTAGTDGQFLALSNVTLGSGVTLNLSGQGGSSAPIGTLRATGPAAVIDGPVNLLTGNVRMSSSGASSELRINGKISDGTNTFGVLFRFGDGNGVYLTNTANDWGGDVTSTGVLRAEPGAIPSTAKILIGGSGNGWFQTNGTLTRSIGTTAGSGAIDLSTNSANRVTGLGARGGALTVNLGNAAADLIWGSTVGFNPAILGLNNSTSDSALTLANPLDLNGANRVIQTDANTATLTGGLKNSSATAAGLRKTGAGTLVHDPGAAHTVTLQSLQTGAGTFEVKSGTLTISSGASTTYAVAMNGFTVVGGSTFRLSGGTVNAKVGGSVFTAGHTTGGTGTFIQDGGTFDAGGLEILNAYGAAGTATINNGTFICGPFRVGQNNGTLNLNGGILRANNLSSGGGTTTVNFNGGTLQAKVANTGFIPTGLTTTQIRAGGAVFDSNGFNVTVAKALTEDPGSTGGGLSKLGAGTLTLGAANSYTGTSTVNAGALEFPSGGLGTTGPVSFTGTSTLRWSTGNTDTLDSRAITVESGVIGTLDTGSNAVTLTAPIGGAGGIGKAGSGTLQLNGANTFTGGITMGSGNNGWIEIDNAADLGSGTKIANLNSSSGSSVGGFRLLNDVTVSGVAVNIAGRNVNAATQQFLWNVSGNNVWTGNLNITNSGGTYYLRSDSGRLELSGTLSNAQPATGAPDTRAFNLEGAGDYLISGTVANGANANRLTALALSGTGTTTLSGTNTYTGTTAVSAGKLLVNGDSSAATGAVSINGTAILGGTGTLGGAVSLAADTTLAPGETTGTLTAAAVAGPASGTASLAIQLNGASADQLVVPGALNITNLTLNLSTLGGGATQPVYLLAKYGTLTGAAFSAVSGLPTGYSVNYAYNDGISSNNIALVTVTSSPYSTWAGTTFGLTGGDALAGADPDGDGVKNLVEFALNGNPTSGSNNGLSTLQIQDASAPAGNELTFTIAVRDGATFTSGVGGAQTATVDGIIYTIQGSLDLSGFTSAVSVIGSASDTAPGLPSLADTAWEYRTFKLDASEGLSGKGFLRVKVDTAP